LITPLRKRARDGTLYVRDPGIEAKLTELVDLTRDEVFGRCAIRRRDDPSYVPSECLMHLVRACRLDNSDRYFERLYKILIERVMRRLPAGLSPDGKAESLTKSKIRDAVTGRMVELLAADRTAYSEKLDYFEVRFDGALASLRRDAQEKAWREENRTVGLELDEETAELSAEVERAAGSFDPFNSIESQEEDYRSRLEAAIDTLPVEQIRIIQMLRLGVPIDSKEEGTVTIAKTLGKSERTIRLKRDKAFAALRAAMKRSEES
jgi:hypothetical protein